MCGYGKRNKYEYSLLLKTCNLSSQYIEMITAKWGHAKNYRFKRQMKLKLLTANADGIVASSNADIRRRSFDEESWSRSLGQRQSVGVLSSPVHSDTRKPTEVQIVTDPYGFRVKTFRCTCSLCDDSFSWRWRWPGMKLDDTCINLRLLGYWNMQNKHVINLALYD